MVLTRDEECDHIACYVLVRHLLARLWVYTVEHSIDQAFLLARICSLGIDDVNCNFPHDLDVLLEFPFGASHQGPHNRRSKRSSSSLQQCRLHCLDEWMHLFVVEAVEPCIHCANRD